MGCEVSIALRTVSDAPRENPGDCGAEAHFLSERGL